MPSVPCRPRSQREPRPRSGSLLAASGALLALACFPEIFGPSAKQLVIVSNDSLMGVAGQLLAESLVVQVLDGDGHPMDGVPVVWATEPGNGTVAPDTSLTDSIGHASARWTLGATVGVQSATAQAEDLPPATFWATVDPNYAVIDLGPGEATSISRSGAYVAGHRYTAASGLVAFVWKDGVRTDFQVFGWGTQVYGVNDSGQVVGSYRPQASVYERAFLWRAGTAVDLGTGGRTSSSAMAINNQGQVVGYIGGPEATCSGWNTDRAVLWENGVLSQLEGPEPLCAGAAMARDINDAGDIVGDEYDYQRFPHAVIWRNGVLTRLFADTNTSEASGISPNGYVVGRRWAVYGYSGPAGSFRWRGGSVEELPSLLIHAAAVNGSGYVVGIGSYPDAHGYTYAAEWRPDGVHNLTPGEIGDAHDIAANNDMAGYRLDGSRNSHAVLWRRQ